MKPDTKWMKLQYYLHVSMKIAKTIIKDKKKTVRVAWTGAQSMYPTLWI